LHTRKRLTQGLHLNRPLKLVDGIVEATRFTSLMAQPNITVHFNCN